MVQDIFVQEGSNLRKLVLVLQVLGILEDKVGSIILALIVIFVGVNMLVLSVLAFRDFVIIVVDWVIFAKVCPSRSGKSSQPVSGVQSNRVPAPSHFSHQSSRPPHKFRGQGDQQQHQPHVRVFALTEDEAQTAPGTVIIGNCILCGYSARVLFDTGASHSFISHAFAISHDLGTTSMNSNLSIATPMGKMIIYDIMWCIMQRCSMTIMCCI